MRDDYEDNFYVTAEERGPDRLARLSHRLSLWLGAALALVVIGSLVFWGYHLGRREATAVPVIRAAIEPAKVQPEDPGGAAVAHQDISSYDAASGGGIPSEITFAPPPERPAEEDVAMGALLEPVAEADGTGADGTGAGGTGADGAGADGAEAASADSEADTDTEPGPDAPELDASGLAPGTSPVALARPGDLSQRMAAARLAISEEAKLAKRAAASPVQIQLGAFPDRSLTRSEWDRIYKANEDILAGRALVVQSTISGGTRFFRLRAGPFKDRVEAQNVCRALQARGHVCIVAVNG